jgi:FMN phosphatase YigB (HAD superfamily)
MAQGRQKIVELLGADESPEDFHARLEARYKSYRNWAFEQNLEAPEAELWTRWLAPDYPVEKVAPLAVELTYQFRQSMGRRVVVPNGKDVVVELYQRSYTLGIISNVITSQEIPDWLEADGLAAYFKTVVSLRSLAVEPDRSTWKPRLAGVEPAAVSTWVTIPSTRGSTRVASFGMSF